MLRPFVLCLAAACFLLIPKLNLYSQAATSPESFAQEFKILTEVFTAQSTSPVSINETIFLKGLVYDFRYASNSHSPLEVSIYQPQKRSFVLLDYAKQQRLELDSLQLIRIVEGMKTDINSHDQMKPVFMDDFVAQNDIENYQVSVSNNFVTYSAVGQRPKNDSMLNGYFQFLDQFTLVGATNPHALPPFPRMQLNREIKKIGFIPTQINLEIKPNDFRPTGLTAHSTHRLVGSLDASDVKKTKTAHQDWLTFKRIELAEYRQIKKLANSQSDQAIKNK